MQSINKKFYIIFVLFFIFTIILSSVKIYRWDIMNYVFMIDNFFEHGNFYPHNKLDTGVSVYPPGNIIFGLLARPIFGYQFYPIIYPIIASLCITTFLIIQIKLANILFNLELNVKNLMLLIVLYLTFFRDWFIYAVEYKPDLISYLYGSLIIYFLKCSLDKPKGIIFLLGLIFPLGLLLKQQYIAFIISVNMIILIFYFQKAYFFLIGSLVSLIFIFLLYQKYDFLIFWNYRVMSDDGWLTFSSWLSDHKRLLIIGILIFLFFLKDIIYGLTKNSIFKIYKNLKINDKNYTYFNIRMWILVSFFILLLAILSSFKAGGNAGNTAWGLVVFAPAIIYLFRKIKLNIIIGFLIFSVSLNVFASFQNNFLKLVQMINSKEKILEVCDQPQRVLVDSESYFIWRTFRSDVEVNDIITYGLKNNIDTEKLLDIEFFLEDYDCIIVSETVFPNLWSNISKIKKTSEVFDFRPVLVIKKIEVSS